MFIFKKRLTRYMRKNTEQYEKTGISSFASHFIIVPRAFVIPYFPPSSFTARTLQLIFFSQFVFLFCIHQFFYV